MNARTRLAQAKALERRWGRDAAVAVTRFQVRLWSVRPELRVVVAANAAAVQIAALLDIPAAEASTEWLVPSLADRSSKAEDAPTLEQRLASLASTLSAFRGLLDDGQPEESLWPFLVEGLRLRHLLLDSPGLAPICEAALEVARSRRAKSARPRATR